jgi:integrase/recombinase XerD
MSTTEAVNVILADGRSELAEAMAVAGFLAGYCGATRRSYASDLRLFSSWCQEANLRLFTARRGHLERFGRWMEERGLSRATIGRRLSTLAGFYRFAVIDGAIEHSPAEYVRRPKVDTESATLGLDRMELGAFIAQAAAPSPRYDALACLLGLLELRVSEALDIDIEDLAIEPGHRTVTVVGEGWKLAVIPLPSRSRASGGPGCRRSPGRTAAVGEIGRAAQPPGRQPASSAAWPNGRGHQAHLASPAAPQLHHRRPRRPACPCGMSQIAARTDPPTPTRYDRAPSQPRSTGQLRRYRCPGAGGPNRRSWASLCAASGGLPARPG